MNEFLDIKEFCKLHSISRSFFYILLKSGQAPKTMKIGKRRLISKQAAENWRIKMEQEANE